MLSWVVQFPPFLMLNNVPLCILCIYTAFSLSIVHLGCLSILAIVNIGAVNMAVQISPLILILIILDMYAGVELLDHTVGLFLVL